MFFYQHVHHIGVGQSRGVAQGAALGNVAQQAPHDLAAAGLGEVGREDDVFGPSYGADLLGDVLLEFLYQIVAALAIALEIVKPTPIP